MESSLIKHACCVALGKLPNLSYLIYDVSKTIANLLSCCKLKINATDWMFVFLQN